MAGERMQKEGNENGLRNAYTQIHIAQQITRWIKNLNHVKKIIAAQHNLLPFVKTDKVEGKQKRRWRKNANRKEVVDLGMQTIITSYVTFSNIWPLNAAKNS